MMVLTVALWLEISNVADARMGGMNDARGKLRYFCKQFMREPPDAARNVTSLKPFWTAALASPRFYSYSPFKPSVLLQDPSKHPLEIIQL